MSNLIKILPDNIANKIAAGEVVQRPESVVKELLENAIDAKSSEIELIIKKAGKILIQVCDNGQGMSEEDALMCIHKHATSKISSYEDLEGILTLGFRGEALASMAAVSQMEIRTERYEDEIGTFIRIDEPGVILKDKGSYPKGTSITIKNLFYNTPGRRNFLKSDATELKHIIDTFNKIALSHPEISFKLFNDNDILFSYKSGDLANRVSEVFADNMLDALIPAEEITEYLKVKGFIGKPAMIKKAKGDQYLFLNNRYVVSKQVNHAVFSAYENILEKGEYPFFLLFLEIDPHKIDVNVHPSKLEVRFEDEKDIYHFVMAVVKKSLGTYDLVPNMSFKSSTDETEKLKFNNFVPQNRYDFSDRPIFNDVPTQTRLSFSNREIDNIFNSIPEPSHKIKNEEGILSGPFDNDNNNRTTSVPSVHKDSDYSFIIQLHNKYILSQIKSGLMIIDQHVAHERILYEKALGRINNGLSVVQPLLFPIGVELNAGKYEIVKEIAGNLNRLGFLVKVLSKNQIIIEGVPEEVKSGMEEVVLLELIDQYVEYSSNLQLNEKDNLAKSYSCKAAIKAGDPLTEDEMRVLIDELFATSMPYVCPHGRPIVIKISLDEFDRRFGRTS